MRLARLNRSEKAENLNKETSERMKQVKATVPLFKEIETKYEKNIVLPKIEQDKRILSEIREVRHKRYDSVEIRKHDIRFKEHKKVHEIQRHKKRNE
jgi:hypothetical protein